MRNWTYTWMSSDGLRHEGEMAAPDKDSVYAALRRRGIRAIKVSERVEPVVRKGFAGLRKRDWALLAAAVAATIAAAAAFFLRPARPVQPRADDTRQSRPPAAVSSQIVQIAQPRPRRFLSLPEGVDFAKTFRHPHEVYLAHYAMPGAGFGETPPMTEELVRDFYDNIGAGIVIDDADPGAVAELKRIVAGMKDDARKYLSVPDGMAKMGAWLEERQQMERNYREQFVSRVKSGNLAKEEANEIFRAMGLREID